MAFETHAQIIGIIERFGREIPHEEPAPRMCDDKAAIFEQARRLTQGRARHAEFGRQLHLVEPRCRRKSPHENRVRQRAGDAVHQIFACQ